MPASRNARHQANAQTTGRRRVPLGPLSLQDPDLANMSKLQARLRNSERLSEVAISVAPQCPDHAKICNIAGHKVGQPKLSVGQKIAADFGRWYQVCYTCKPRKVRFLTERLPSHQRFNAEVQRLLAIAEELKPTLRQSVIINPQNIESPAPASSSSLPVPPSPLPPSSPPLRQSVITNPQNIESPAPASSSSLPALPSPLPPSSPPLPSSFSPVTSLPSPSPSPMPTTPAGQRLDTSKPVTVIFWIQVGVPPITTTLYPRWDGKLHLKDFKIQLGKLGIEQGNPIETYFYGFWDRLEWKTPLRIDYVRQKFMFRYLGVGDTFLLNEYLQYLQ